MSARQFVLDRPERVPAFTGWLGKQSLPLDVVVKPYEPKRSNPQNARLWKLHGLAADVTGYDSAEMHEKALCKHFGYTEVERRDPLTGRMELTQIPNERSSVQLKKKFAEFMEATEAWYATEFGVWLNQDTL